MTVTLLLYDIKLNFLIFYQSKQLSDYIYIYIYFFIVSVYTETIEMHC